MQRGKNPPNQKGVIVMKRKLLALLLALSMTLSLCTGVWAADAVPGEEGVTSGVTDSDGVQAEYPEAPTSDQERWKVLSENPVDQEFLKAINVFAQRTGAKLLSKKGGCYSPLSLYYALALVSEGARGQTAEELYSLLGEDADDMGTQCANLYRRLYTANGPSTLLIANSLWLDDEVLGLPVHFREEYLNKAKEDYYASVFKVDFSDKATGEKMGNWVRENTKGMLNFSLEPSDEQMMAILNTVYFKSRWQRPFQKADTSKAKFTLANGKKKKIKFMHCKEEGSYYKGKNYTAAYRTMKSGRVTFYLPDKGVDVHKLLKQKDLFSIPASKYKDCDLKWSVPKFKSENKWDLIPSMKKLGVNLAFTNDADFSALSDTPATISAIEQGTRFDMNEKGAEAAAYTYIAVDKATAVMPQKRKTVKMNLNRPFLYTITSEDGVVLFMGIYDGK